MDYRNSQAATTRNIERRHFNFDLMSSPRLRHDEVQVRLQCSKSKRSLYLRDEADNKQRQ